MRSTLCIIMISFCLSGCSELRVIGNAATRELRADAVAVNWAKSVPGETVAAEHELLASAKVKTFSSFKSASKTNKAEKKGLWEQGGRKYLVAAR